MKPSVFWVLCVPLVPSHFKMDIQDSSDFQQARFSREVIQKPMKGGHFTQKSGADDIRTARPECLAVIPQIPQKSVTFQEKLEGKMAILGNTELQFRLRTSGVLESPSARASTWLVYRPGPTAHGGHATREFTQCRVASLLISFPCAVSWRNYLERHE